jgi:hypothetical protein
MRRKFLVLYRLFLARMIDLDILSARGERDLIARFVSVLAAFSLVLTYLLVPRYATTTLPRARLIFSIWNDEEFLISATIAVAGLFAVLAWNAVFPDRRDCLVLAPLPVPTPILIAAKLAAMATALGIGLVAINVFTGAFFPISVRAPATSPLRAGAAWWTTIFGAGTFIFSAMLALQGLAAQLMSWRLFLRISGLLQLAALFAVIALFFVTPSFALTMQSPGFLIQLLPSFWFTGLLHKLNGDSIAIFDSLSAIALRNLSVAVSLAAILWALSWYRNIRRIVEAPDIAPSRHWSIAGFLAARIHSRGIDRAVLMFTACTIARSRQHRLLLAACGGIGFATALAFSRTFLEGRSRARWDEPNVPFLIAGLLLLYCAIAGMKAAFAIPLALPANWIFRLTAVHSPAAYFSAVRKSLIVLAAVPVWIAAAIAYFSIWPGRPALEHMLVLIAAGLLLADLSLHQFRKIPFACSWLPGGVQLKMRLGVNTIVFLTFAGIFAGIELFSIQRVARFAPLIAILFAVSVWARRRAAAFAGASANRIQFEDTPPADVFALDLRADGDWSSDEAYVDTIGAYEGKTLAARLKPAAIFVLALLIVGFDWEQAGEWRDRKLYPQVGRSFNIGGRSLNIHCSGEGSPTVILEADWGAPGYSWVAIQREIAKFTRACWYDRAGYGWSDAGPFPSHSDSIARDLHQLLGAAGVAPPYVLVAHGLGAFHARVFRGFYSGEVAGMVLADPMSEDITIGIHNHIEALRPAVVFLFRTFGLFGGFRLLAPDPGPPPSNLTPREWSTIAALRWQAKSMPSQTKEPPLWIDGELARASGIPSSLPLIVLSAGLPGQAEDPQLADLRRNQQLQEQLARRSTRGRHLVLANSHHMIPWEAPEAVIRAAREVVDEIRP